MTMLRDEMSGKNDSYKKPAGYDLHITGSKEQQAALANMMLGNPVMTGQEWYDRATIEVLKVLKARVRGEYKSESNVINGDFGHDLGQALKRAANLIDKENTK